MSYVLYRIAMTIAIMVFVVLASIYYHFFPLTAIMLIALALLDDVPIMTIAFDNASVPPQPVKWELDRVLVISSVLGLLGVIQSFGLLYLGDTLHHLDYPQLRTMMFLQLVAGGHLMLFVTRTRGALWKPPYPNPKLFFDCRDPNHCGAHVQPGLAGAATFLEDHRPCLGLQSRLDDRAGRRQTGALWSSGPCSLVEEVDFPVTPGANDTRARGG